MKPPVAARNLLIIILLVLIYSMPATAGPAGGAGSPANAVDVNDESLLEVWSLRNHDLDQLMEETRGLQEDAEEQVAPLGQSISRTRMEISRLLGLYQASYGYPSAQLALFLQMRALQDSFNMSVQPLQSIKATIQARMDEVGQLQEGLHSLNDEAGAELTGGSAQSAAQMKNYQKLLSDTQNRLKNAAKRLDRILAPAQATRERISAALNNIESGMLDTWRAYYFTPASGVLDIFDVSGSQVSGWLNSLGTRMGLTFPNGSGAWFNSLKNFAVSVLFLALLGGLVARTLHRLPKRWSEACRKILAGPWIWVSIGWGMVMAAGSSQGSIYLGLLLPGVLMLIWGIGSLSWRLRTTAQASLAGKPSPLNRLYVPAALGILFLYSDLPPRILSIFWIMVMLLSTFWALRHRRVKEKLPFLERLAYNCSFYFSIASLLVAFSGYARLAILLFLFLFAVINVLILGHALNALASLVADKLFVKKDKPLRNALLHAIVIPLSWMVSLLCTLPWVWAIPGARYVINYVLSTNYELGEASLDFGKIIIIIILFFLFRSFINLGKTSLSQLPQRMPYIEKGVIPPLQALLGYALWAVLGLVVLGMLGVNFTSLAVVAGGLSVGIGFGMQNLFNNLVSGIMLIFGRTVLVGDYVEVAGISGTVKAIKIRSTVIETFDKALVFVPNSTIMAGQFVNWTREQRMMRRGIAIGVAYGTDTQMVSELLLEIAGEQEHVLSDPAPFVWFDAFGDSSLNFTLYVYIDDYSNGGSTATAIRHTIARVFAEKKIEIPFPQMDVHLNKTGPAA